MKLKIIDIAHHRNGICGEPFVVVLFKDQGPEGSRKLAAGNIEFGFNSWRGDNYEPHLRQANHSNNPERSHPHE